ncbi:MAG: hypothetical protein KKA28_00475 [Planctomycetes bacterium]|nr:hypothetical protein [Planctomycetota bacterium]
MTHQRSRRIGNRRAWPAVPGFCLLILLGCTPATERQALEGTVALDGAPLAEGSILFLPQPGTKGPTSGGKIAQGRFSISPAGGAFSGVFRVEITAVRNTGRKVMDPRMGNLIDETEQFIPVRYNRESELTAQVSEQGPNQFEFALESK